MTEHKKFWKRERGIYRFLIIVCALVLILAIVAIYFIDKSDLDGVSDQEYNDVPTDDINRIENGIHVRTGLVQGEGLKETVNNCTTCHSAKLLTQNRMDAVGWKATIKWMQETQNLWELGEKEEVIVNYLVKHYPSNLDSHREGRRENLDVEEWYVLDQ